MVSWTGDGLIAGYDPITKRLKPDLYHFATPGSVDLQGVTRLHYKTADGLSTATYPNKLQAKAPMSLVAGDFAANPGRKLGPVMVLAPAGYFPDNYVPTPSEILALAPGNLVARMPDLVYTGPVARTWTFTEYNEEWPPNFKFWVLIYMASFHPTNSILSIADVPPMNGVDVNTFGRAVSIWPNRTPAKPVITSPVDGTISVPGSTFTFTYASGDPDKVAPSDAPTRFNDDIAGVHIQYAPAPSISNPSPEWKDLQVFTDLGLGGAPINYDGWTFRERPTGTGPDYLGFLIDNLGCPIQCGVGAAEHVTGAGYLPSGDWQLRVRTFDFGHPYPNMGTDFSMPGPAGLNQSLFVWPFPAKDNYPSVNTSPWSDPVRVSIPAQVPPPIPLSPVSHEAVSGNSPVQLSWQYRNTHIPPRTQYQRTVQIRKVGDPDWATVFSGVSSDPYVNLPTTLTQTPVPDLNMLADGGFEGGGLDGWALTAADVTAGLAIANVNSAPGAHSGSHYLRVTNPIPSGPSAARYPCMTVHNFTPPAIYDSFDISGWVWVPDGTANAPFIMAQAVWYDAGGAMIVPDDYPNTPFVYMLFTDQILTPAAWYDIQHPPSTLIATPYGATIRRPPGGVTLTVTAEVNSNIVNRVIPEMRIDDWTITGHGPDLDDFTFSATNEYEWRVLATDTDGKTSDYSAPAQFWAVPDPNTGPSRVVPAETIEGATLGCGTHRVEVYRRGGKERVGEIKNISHLDYSRVRDDISTANIVISGWDIDCGNLLAQLQTWAYEVVIWRDNGFSVDRVWEGPITLLTFETDAVTIDAKDVMAFLYRRIIKQKMSDAGTGNGKTVVDRARRVIQNCLAPDDPNMLSYLQVLARSDDAMEYRSTPAYSRTAFEEIDDMAANAGLDYTVVGRAILLWGTKHRIGTLPEFRDEDLGNSPIVSEYGMSFANRYVVSDGNGVWGEATRLDVSGNDETYGLVEMLSSTWASDSENESGTYTQEGLATVIDSFEHFAERSISDRTPPPVVVRIPDNTSLNPGTVISFQNLVPGVVIPLRSTKTLRQVVASQKLDSVKVVEEGGKETVSITVSPFSRDDAIVVED